MRLGLPIDPASLPTAQQKGVTRDGRVYTKAKVRRAKERLTVAIEAAAGRTSWTDGERESAPWACHVELVYRLASTRRRDFGSPKATRPDVDNALKLILDALTACGRFWADDGQVAELTVVKRHAHAAEPVCEQAHVTIWVTPLWEGLRAVPGEECQQGDKHED